MSIADIYGMKPYNIMDAINQGLGTVNNISNTRMGLKYAPKEEEAKYQNMLAGLASAQAQAAAAPRYYGGRADLVNNQAGQTAMETSLMPKKYQLEASSVGSENALRNAQMAILRAKLQGLANPGYSPLSPSGKLLMDYQNIVQTKGLNSPEAIALKQILDKQGSVNNGITVMSPDGKPMVQIGGSSGSGSSGGQTLVDSKGTIFSRPTNSTASRLQQAEVTDPQLVAAIKEETKNILPYLTIGGKAKLLAQKGANLLGAQYIAPTDYNYVINSLIPQAAEGLLRKSSLNPTSENVALMVKSLTPQLGDSANGILEKTARQLQFLKNISTNAKKQLSTGIEVGQMQAAAPATQVNSLPKGSETYDPETGKFTVVGE